MRCNSDGRGWSPGVRNERRRKRASPVEGLKRLAEQNDDEKGQKKRVKAKGRGGRGATERRWGGGGVEVGGWGRGGDSPAEGLDVCCHLEINQNLEPADQNSALGPLWAPSLPLLRSTIPLKSICISTPGPSSLRRNGHLAHMHRRAPSVCYGVAGLSGE